MTGPIEQEWELRANGVAVKNSILETRGPKRLYLYLRRANGKRVVLVLSASFLLLVLAVLFCFLFIQDLALSPQIFPGITIEGVAVGGMTKSQATELVSKSVATPIMEPMVLTNEKHEFTLDLKSIDMSVDVQAMVDKAYSEGRRELFLIRMFRRFLNKPIHKDIPVIVKYDENKLNVFVDTIAEYLNVAARSSSVDMSKGSPSVSSSRYGLRVMEDGTRNSIVAALPTGNRMFPVIVESVKPDVTEADIGYIIVIKQAEHKLYLYSGEEYIDNFACAVGSPQYPTPNGRFTIVKKEKDPTWYPPKSAWAKDVSSAPIPPGPGNPLGPYWMEIGDGVGIHSTGDEKSLGYSVSHGCIRVSEWAAMYIFNRVEKGTAVYIYP